MIFERSCQDIIIKIWCMTFAFCCAKYRKWKQSPRSNWGNKTKSAKTWAPHQSPPDPRDYDHFWWWSEEQEPAFRCLLRECQSQGIEKNQKSWPRRRHLIHSSSWSELYRGAKVNKFYSHSMDWSIWPISCWDVAKYQIFGEQNFGQQPYIF